MKMVIYIKGVSKMINHVVLEHLTTITETGTREISEQVDHTERGYVNIQMDLFMKAIS